MGVRNPTGYGVRTGNYYSEVGSWLFSQEMIRVPRLAGSSGAQKHPDGFLDRRGTPSASFR